MNPCQICGDPGTIHWTPFFFDEDGRLQPTNGGYFGQTVFCTDHFNGLIKAIEGWLDEAYRSEEHKVAEPCGAQSWGRTENDEILAYGTCQKPRDHKSRWHREMRDGQLWAEWSGPNERAPEA